MTFYGINGNCSLRFDDWNKKAALCTAGNNYHCLLNDLGTYGEICVPSTWIQPNLCPVYNTKVQQIDVRLCKYEYGKCPLTAYLSNKVYQYSACFHDDNTAIDSSTTLRSTTKAESGPGLPPWAVPILIVSLVLCIGILALVTTLLVRRFRNRIKKRLNLDEEEPMLPDEKNPEPEIQKHDEDNTFYDGIEAVAEGWKKLTQYGVVILVGVTGAGKTKCGLELLSMVRVVKTVGRIYKCHILRNFDDFEKIASSKVHYCLFLDNCLDRWSYSGVGPSIKNDIIRLENVFNNYVRGKSAQVVLTVNVHTWNRFAIFLKGRNFFRAEHIISVGTLSYKTKMEVLKTHLSSIGEDALEERMDNEQRHGLNKKDTKDHQLPEPMNDHFGTDKKVDEKYAVVHRRTECQNIEQEKESNEKQDRKNRGGVRGKKNCEDGEHKKSSESGQGKRNSGDGQDKKNSGDEKDKKNSGDEKDKKKSDEQDKKKSGDEEDKKKSGDKQDKKKSGEEQDKKKSGDEQDKKNSGDEQDKKNSGDGQEKKNSGDGQDKKKSGDGQDKKKSEDEQDKKKSGDEEDKKKKSGDKQDKKKSGDEQDKKNSGDGQEKKKGGDEQDKKKSDEQDKKKSGDQEDKKKSGDKQDKKKSGEEQDKKNSGDEQDKKNSGDEQDKNYSGDGQEKKNSGDEQDKKKSGDKQDKTKSGDEQDKKNNGDGQEKKKSGVEQDKKKSGDKQDKKKSGDKQDQKKSGDKQDKKKIGDEQEKKNSGDEQEKKNSEDGQSKENSEDGQGKKNSEGGQSKENSEDGQGKKNSEYGQGKKISRRKQDKKKRGCGPDTGNSGEIQDKENSGDEHGNKNKTRGISDSALGRSPVNDESREIQGGETKYAGNHNGGGKDCTDVDSNPQKLKENTSEKCQGDTPTSKPSTRPVASNTQQSYRQSPRDLKGDTDACSSGKIKKNTSSHIKAGEDTQEKDINEEAIEDGVHSIGCNSKLVKQSGKGGPTQVPTEENKRERRYKVDEKMIEKIAKEPWKENPKIGFQPKKPFYLGFPEACALYSRDDKIMEKGEEFFKDPINCLSKRFSEWRDSKEIKEREKYVALVYMLMNGGYMDIRSIKGELLNVAKSFCKDGYIINEDAVKEGVAVLARNYCVEKSPGCFEFQHEIIEYTLLYQAVSKDPKQTFEYCDLNVLKRHMITKKNKKPEGELKVPVDSYFFDLLAHRFVMSAVTLENHRCMEDKRFERKYKTHQGTAV